MFGSIDGKLFSHGWYNIKNKKHKSHILKIS